MSPYPQGDSASRLVPLGDNKTAPGGATNTVAPGALPTNEESTNG